MGTLEIVEKMEQGELTPQEAVKRAEVQAVHIGDVKVDLKVDILDCGFPSLNDSLVFKKNRGELIVLGARPSHGKSAFAFQVAAHIAKTDNVLIYSLEMDRESIKARMLAGATGRGLTALQKGLAPKHEIDVASKEIAKLKYFIDDRSLDAMQIRSSAVAFHKHYPVSLVVVDYLQLVKTRSRASRNEEVGDISSELKSLAKDLKCPVLVASQLNRQVEIRGKQTGDYSPTAADLRDSGSIEQDADIVMFLSRMWIYNGSRKEDADIKVAKNRNGPTGSFVFGFHGPSTTFKDRQERMPEDTI